MTPMRLGLIVIGVFVILAVWIFNKLQERRIQQGMEGRFGSSSSDILLDDREPTGGSSSTESEAMAPNRRGGERFEPRLGEALAPHDDGIEPVFAASRAEYTPPTASAPAVDPLIHAVMTLTAETALPGERWISALHGLRHAGRHQVVVEGDTAFGPAPLEASQRYTVVRVGVQLANRSGALNEIEFSEFVSALHQQAEQLGANCIAPDMMETIAAARALDARCAPLDAMIGVNVACPQGSWPVSRVVEVARNLGLSARHDHRLAAFDATGEVLYVLQNGDGGALLGEQGPNSTQRVTLLLELPRVRRDEQPFELMRRAALAFAEQLSGIVVDDEMHTLTEASLAGIGRQIEPVYDQLEGQGLAAGSARALALFR